MLLMDWKEIIEVLKEVVLCNSEYSNYGLLLTIPLLGLKSNIPNWILLSPYEINLDQWCDYALYFWGNQSDEMNKFGWHLTSNPLYDSEEINEVMS